MIKKNEVYPLLGCCVVGGSSLGCVGKMHHTQFQGSSSPIKNATPVGIQRLCQLLLGGRKFMLINSVVDGLKGPLLILVVVRWWRPNMLVGGYWAAAQGKEGETGKREQNVGHYKPLSLSRGRREIGRRNDMCPPLSFTFSTLCSPSPAGHFTMCTSWHADLPTPHHNQLSPSKVIGPRKLSCLPFTTDTLLMACWAV